MHTLNVEKSELLTYIDKIQTAPDQAKVDSLRQQLLGKNGIITNLMKTLKDLPPEEKRHKGQEYNQWRTEVMQALQTRQVALDDQVLVAKLQTETIDVTLPSVMAHWGKIHPLTQVRHEVTTIFQNMGFSLAIGPEIEDEEHNFDALNIPSHHPAREEQDTFYLKEQHGQTPLLLRTQTSNVQIRYMRQHQPPFRIIAPGRTYRSDNDATHTPSFHQIEGLLIDKDVTMAHLKGCLQRFLEQFFKIPDIKMRFRPAYFPFTEPSAEIDIAYQRSNDQVLLGQGNDWLEILGCGMVHPKVLENCGIDPTTHQGFAFGMGLERLTMLKYQLPDLRAFFDGDLRWTRQNGFAFAHGLSGAVL